MTRAITLTAATFSELLDVGSPKQEHPKRINRGETCTSSIRQVWPSYGILEFSTGGCGQKWNKNYVSGVWTQLVRFGNWEDIVSAAPELLEAITSGRQVSFDEIRTAVGPLFEDAEVQLFCDCVTGDTRVLTDNGWRTVYSLAEPLILGNYTQRYVVDGVTHNGTPPFFKGVQSVYEISFSNGLDVCATADHLFLTYSTSWNGKRRVERKVWRPVCELQVDDRLVVTDNPWTLADLSDTDFWEGFFVGVLMGDGTLFGNGTPDLQLYKPDSQEIIDLLAKSGTVQNVSPLNGRYGFRVSFNHRAMELMHKFSYENKKSVNITNERQLQGYVSGLIVTDGSVQERDVSIHGGHDYLRQLAEYLISFGRPFFGMALSREAGVQTNLGTSTKELWVLRFAGPNLRRMTLALTKDQQYKVTEICAQSPNRKRPTTKVVSTKYSGRRPVYDITIPSVGRFVANGVLAHNCSDFLYSGAKYNDTVGGAIYPGMEEGRDPQWHREHELGYARICKHLYSVFHRFLGG